MSNPKGVKAKEIYNIIQKLNTSIKLHLLLEDIKKNASDSAHLSKINKELGRKRKRALAKLERRAFSDILDYLKSYYRDALLIASGADSKMLINIDVKEEITEAAKTLSVKNGILATSYIKEAKERLISNVSPSLTLETLFFKLQEAYVF